MSPSIEYPPRGYTTQDVHAVLSTEARRPRARPWLAAFGVFVVAPAVLLALWAALARGGDAGRGSSHPAAIAAPAAHR